MPTLDALIDAGHQVPLVVCQPDRAAGRSRKLQPPPVKQAALRHGLELFQPDKVRCRAFRERLEAENPDLLVVVAYGRILGEPTLHCAPHGAVNVHFSLLPSYRGAAPVQWALARGETVTGVSTMRMSRGLDAGDILLQRDLKIRRSEHTPALMARLAELGAELLLETLTGLNEGSLQARPQDPAAATYAPPLSRQDGFRDPEDSAESIAACVRAFDPWPGVWFRIDGKRVRIRKAEVVETPDSQVLPGTVVKAASDGLVLACGGGSALAVEVLQFEGRKAVTAADAVHGRAVREGDRVVRETQT